MSAIIGRFGTARVAVVAFASLVAGYAVFLRVGVQPDYPTVILPAVALIGVAFSLGFSALSLAATDGVADRSRAWRPACSRPPSRSAARSCSQS
jgi:hypothetical protein